jgi:ABC-2 type transport system ATP-binding protein
MQSSTAAPETARPARYRLDGKITSWRSEMSDIGQEHGAGPAATGPAPAEPVISARGLVKRYGSHEAVAGIDLEVRHGEIFAFLGPNGAGKTTTVEILEGFRQRTAGEISVLGHDPATAGGNWRERVGVVLQESEPEPGLSVRECLAMYAGYYRKPRDIDETIALVGLTARAGALGTRLSGGQRRRLDFALALIGDPELIFLDEPTTGFDPSARRAAWEVVAGLRQLGKTIFLTTHYMEEAEYLADRIAVLSAGRIVARGTARTLGGRDHLATAISFTLPNGLATRDLPDGLRPLAEPAADGSTVLHSESPLVHLQMLGNWAIGRGFDLPDLDVHRPTLEEVYLSLTGSTSTKDQP